MSDTIKELNHLKMSVAMLSAELDEKEDEYNKLLETYHACTDMHRARGEIIIKQRKLEKVNFDKFVKLESENKKLRDTLKHIYDAYWTKITGDDLYKIEQQLKTVEKYFNER